MNLKAIALCVLLTGVSLRATNASRSPVIAVCTGLWSDPAVWRHRHLPGGNDTVEIAPGTTVYLDQNATIARLVVSGAGAVLSCLPNNAIDTLAATNERPIVLESGTILVGQGGCFTCGAGDCRREPEQFNGNLWIRLRTDMQPTGADDDRRSFVVMEGGSLYLSGRQRATGITRLARHAMAGDTTIVVSDPRVASAALGGWNPGELIAIAPTDYDPSHTEYRRIVKVEVGTSGGGLATLTLDSSLAYSHNGRRLEITGSPNGRGTFVIDTRAEVALLSRNIVIEGSPGEPTGLGGDVRIMGRSSRALMKWTELRFLGRRGHLGRYPLHLHGAADGAVISGVSVHDSYQRGVVLHCTNNAQVRDTVVSGVYGFAFMLEDGAEEGNVLRGNLAMDIVGAIQHTTNATVTEHGNPAAFWFVNPANSFVDNMAAGVQGSGFSWEMLRDRTASYTLCPQDVAGYDLKLFNNKEYAALDASVYDALMRNAFVEFRNNSAHSMRSGIWFRANNDQISASNLPSRQSVIDGFTAWKLLPRLIAPPEVQGSHHDACVHIFGIARLKFSRLACINSWKTYWSSQSNMINDTLLAWVEESDGKDNDGGGATGRPYLVWSSHASKQNNAQLWQWNQAFVTYTHPQSFLNVRVYGRYGRGIFLAMSMGSVASPNTIVSGFSSEMTQEDTRVPSNSYDIAHVLSQSTHVFTDLDGTWLAAGPGARVLASCPGCRDRADPIIDAYAPGACVPIGRAVEVVGTAAASPSQEYESAPLNSTPRRVRAEGSSPLLCSGASAPQLAAVVMTFSLSENAPSIAPSLFISKAFGGPPNTQYLRAASAVGANMANFLVLLVPESTSAFGGYKITSSNAWFGIRELTLSLGPAPSASPYQSLTLVLAGLRPDVRFSASLPADPETFTVLDDSNDRNNASDAKSCATIVAACSTNKDNKASSGSVCVCRDVTDDAVFIRFSRSLTHLEPSAYDAHGSNYLSQAISLRVNWEDHGGTIADARTRGQFDQLARMIG